MAIRRVPEINASSMADIAFLLLIFFLVTTQMKTEVGIQRVLPPIPDPKAKIPEVKERNLLKIDITRNDQVLVNGSATGTEGLRDRIRFFVANNSNDSALPEKKFQDIYPLGKVAVSRGIVFLKSHPEASYETYIRVQNEITAAFQLLRDQLSKEKFGVPLASLSDPQKKEAIRQAIPAMVSESEPEPMK